MLQLEDPALIDVEDALTGILRQASVRRLHDVIAARAGLALDRAAYPILVRLYDQGRLRLSDLAAALYVSMPTASRQVKQLEAAGLVRRAGDPADGRASLLELTPKGRRALERLRAARRRALAEILSSWDGDERAQLAVLLRRLAGDLASLRR